MILKRKGHNILLDWKRERHEKGREEALLIKGARQVGNSFLVERFGEKEHDSFIEINFIKNPELKAVFKGSKEPKDIYNKLSLYLPNLKLIPGKTLFFLDEIQNSGDARTALKFLASDMNYDFIASGSLLGLQYGEDGDKEVEIPDSIPVGYEMPITLYSLDFEEYLWALGYQEEQIAYLKTFFEKGDRVPNPINNKLGSLFREYMVIGGMPEVVSAYLKTNNFNEAIRVQEKIISDYQNEISKHAKGREKIKARACYDSIPRQLVRELKRFRYSFVEKKQTSRKYGSSIQCLKDSSLVYPCYNVHEPFVPLMANEIEEQFKLYVNDTGLLTMMYGRDTKIAIINDTIKGNVRGAVYENVIGELLVKKGYSLHYYKPDDNHELEFLIEKDGEVLPIEVKAGNNPSASLNSFIRAFHPSFAYKLTNGNVGFNEAKRTIPHYMVLFL